MRTHSWGVHTRSGTWSTKEPDAVTHTHFFLSVCHMPRAVREKMCWYKEESWDGRQQSYPLSYCCSTCTPWCSVCCMWECEREQRREGMDVGTLHLNDIPAYASLCTVQWWICNAKYQRAPLHLINFLVCESGCSSDFDGKFISFWMGESDLCALFNEAGALVNYEGKLNLSQFLNLLAVINYKNNCYIIQSVL